MITTNTRHKISQETKNRALQAARDKLKELSAEYDAAQCYKVEGEESMSHNPWSDKQIDPKWLTPKLYFKKLNEDAIVPTRGSEGAIGYDLYAAEDGFIQFCGRKLVKTGIAVAIPDGYYGRIAPRSGLALKWGVDVMAGVIDGDYRGEIGVILSIQTPKLPRIAEDAQPIIASGKQIEGMFHWKKGDRIAQLIIERAITPEIEVVEELPETKRGTGAYGSTGV